MERTRNTACISSYMCVNMRLTLDINVGTFVRLAPNHISVAHPDALHEITGHSTGTTKSDFYDALVNFNFPSVVSTRDRAAHAYKRRIVAHSMAPKTVLEFEPIVRHHQRQLVSQWDDLCAAGEKNVAGSVGHCTWSVKDGRVWFDCLPCEYAYSLS